MYEKAKAAAVTWWMPYFCLLAEGVFVVTTQNLGESASSNEIYLGFENVWYLFYFIFQFPFIFTPILAGVFSSWQENQADLLKLKNNRRRHGFYV